MRRRRTVVVVVRTKIKVGQSRGDTNGRVSGTPVVVQRGRRGRENALICRRGVYVERGDDDDDDDDDSGAEIPRRGREREVSEEGEERKEGKKEREGEERKEGRKE